MELIMTENFATLNYCGFAKILKKHDKYTGSVETSFG
jgi:SPX domain protein involved in polyphosphate accumulation